MAETNITEQDKTVLSVRENLMYEAKDEDLLQAINKAIAESKPLKEEMDKIGKRNKAYWKNGTEVNLSLMNPNKARVVTNRIFTDVETAIPILTSEPPEPTILNTPDNNLKEKLKKGLQIAYEVKYKMQQKLQNFVRHWYLFRIGILKYRWDVANGFTTENVLPRKIGLDKRATLKDNCEYIWEELEDTLENIIAKFPGQKKTITDIIGVKDLKTKVKYTEFWGGNGEWVCWKLQNIILDKKKNPNFNYDGQNIFKSPQFPYILLNVFAFGDETGLYDETSLIEEVIPLQEGANKLEQQIIDLNEGQKRVWNVLGRAMSKEEAQKLVDKTGDLMIYQDKNGLPGDISQVQSGKPDASLFNNLSHLLSEEDNVMGIHSTTRGAETSRQETLGAQQLQMGSDYGRLDLIVRNIEQAMEEWYNAYLQMLLVYSIEPEILSNGEEEIELNATDITPGILIMVKKGTTLPIDERSKMANAKELAVAGMIDPATLFEEMGYPNVEKRVQDLYLWLQATGKIQLPPQTVAGGQPGAPQGQEIEQLVRLKQMVQQGRQMPPEAQTEIAQKGQSILQNIGVQ